MDTLRRDRACSTTPYIVFTSDNGYSLGEHRFVGKDVLTDEVLQVPLLVRGPGIAPGTTSDLPVTLVDLPATFAAITGVAPQWPVDGTSAGADPARARPALPRHHPDPDRRRTAGRRLVLPRACAPTATSTASTAPTRSSTTTTLDPDEMVNRIDDPAYAAVRAALEERRSRLVGCAGWTCNQTFGPLPDPLTTG